MLLEFYLNLKRKDSGYAFLTRLSQMGILVLLTAVYQAVHDFYLSHY